MSRMGKRARPALEGKLPGASQRPGEGAKLRQCLSPRWPGKQIAVEVTTTSSGLPTSSLTPSPACGSIGLHSGLFAVCRRADACGPRWAGTMSPDHPHARTRVFEERLPT